LSRVDFKSEGAGTAVVFLHGVGGGSDNFRFQLDVFAAQGYRAVAWDMPGYGHSTALEAMTFPALADALLMMIDDLGADRVHAVGHSIGGMVVQEFARDHQHRLASMVLAQTSPAFGNPDGEFQKKFLADRLQPLEEGRTMLDIARSVVPGLVGRGASDESRELAVAFMSRIQPETYAAAMRCIVSFEGRDHLAKIAVPTLVLAGDQDSNAPAPMMEKMASKIPGAEYALLTDTGHLAPIENATAFNEVTLDFVRRHS